MHMHLASKTDKERERERECMWVREGGREQREQISKGEIEKKIETENETMTEMERKSPSLRLYLKEKSLTKNIS